MYLAYSYAVEQDVASGRNTTHPALKHNLIALGATGSETLHPVDEAEPGDENRHHKSSDYQMIGLCFHQVIRIYVKAARARSPQKYSSIQGCSGRVRNSSGVPVLTIFLSASTATRSQTVKMVSRSWVTI